MTAFIWLFTVQSFIFAGFVFRARDTRALSPGALSAGRQVALAHLGGHVERRPRR